MTSLITQTPNSVTDTSLLKMGDIKLKVKLTKVQEIDVSTTYARSGSGVRISGDGYFTDSTGAENKGTFQKYASGMYLNKYYLSVGEYYLYIEDAYKVLRIAFFSQYFYIEKWPIEYMNATTVIYWNSLFDENGYRYISLDSISSYVGNLQTVYCGFVNKNVLLEGDISKFGSPLTVFEPGNSNIYGNLSDLVSTKIESLVIENYIHKDTPVNGSIISLGNRIKLKILNLRYQNVEGAVEDMLDAMVSNGKTSGTLTVRLDNTKCTYGGVALTAKKIFTFSADGWAEN